MGKVKSALEIALEKAGKIGELSPEEKEKIKDEDKVMSVLKEFYQGKIDPNGLWQQFKGSRKSLLNTAQMSIIDTLSLGSLQEEMIRRKEGILAIETLKEKPNTAVIESNLNAIGAMQKEYEEMKKQVVEDLKKQIEAHPQLRMKPVKMPDGKTVMQMSGSVDEAVKNKLSEYLSEHEEQYTQEFSEIIMELKEAIT
jgi:hypothetical protein